MKNLFVPYKLALQLKKKGFNEDCFAGYSCITKGNSKHHYLIIKEGINEGTWIGYHKIVLLAPLYQQVIDWFDKKGIHIDITPEFYKDGINWNFQVFEYAPDFFMCTSDRSTMMYGDNHEYPTRRDAIIGAIKKALELV